MKLTKENIEKIKKFVDDELRIRCINVTTELKVVKHPNGRLSLDLSSTEFNTIPVIHSAIRISHFSTSIWEAEDNILQEDLTVKKLKRLRFYLEVSAQYVGNSVTLFNVYGMKNKGNDYLFISTSQLN